MGKHEMVLGEDGYWTADDPRAFRDWGIVSAENWTPGVVRYTITTRVSGMAECRLVYVDSGAKHFAARVAELEAVLRELGGGTDLVPFCASCGNTYGHLPDCRLAAALDRKETT